MSDGLWASGKIVSAFVNYVNEMMKNLPKEITLLIQ